MRIKILINLLAITIMITGCMPTTATVSSLALTQTLAPEIPASTPSIPKNPSDTATPSASPTTVPKPSMTYTLTPTFTPRPTLEVEDAKTIILDLVQNHEGCSLPCLWGFIPGESDLATARAFVEQFGIGDVRKNDLELGAHNYSDGGSVGISYTKNEISIIIHWSYNKSRETSKVEFLTMYSYPMESVGIDPINQHPIMSPVYGDLTFNEELQDYLLSSILTTYGQPTQILLTVRPDKTDESQITWHPFSLALFYPEQGIFAEYVSIRETVGSNFVGCPDKSQINLVVWDPKNVMPLEHLIEYAGLEIMVSVLKPIDEATSLTLEEFYETFKNPQNTICLETPMEVWSGK